MSLRAVSVQMKFNLMPGKSVDVAILYFQIKLDSSMQWLFSRLNILAS